MNADLSGGRGGSERRAGADERPGTAGVPPARKKDEGKTRNGNPWRSRGYLPHFEAKEISQHLVFRLIDSIPASLLNAIERELAGLVKSRMELERRRKMEEILDGGSGKAWLKDPDLAGIVEKALLRFDGEKYRLHSWCIMPNHVHVLAAPMDGWTLGSIAHSWKSFTAKKANEVLGKTGSFWHREYYDRYIRTKGHFDSARRYIEMNPVKAGLCGFPWEWPHGSARFERIWSENEIRAGGTPAVPGTAMKKP